MRGGSAIAEFVTNCNLLLFFFFNGFLKKKEKKISKLTGEDLTRRCPFFPFFFFEEKKRIKRGQAAQPLFRCSPCLSRSSPPRFAWFWLFFELFWTCLLPCRRPSTLKQRSLKKKKKRKNNQKSKPNTHICVCVGEAKAEEREGGLDRVPLLRTTKKSSKKATLLQPPPSRSAPLSLKGSFF